MRAGLPHLLGLLLALGAPGCGKHDEEGSAADPNRTDWKQTFEAAMDALERVDYRALQALLTPSGRTTLETELHGFSAKLVDPVEGSRMIGKIRARWPDVPEALIEGAKADKVEDAWTLFMRAASPPGVRPRQAGMRMDPTDKNRMQLLYRYGEGTGRELPISLLRHQGRWAVDQIALGPPP